MIVQVISCRFSLTLFMCTLITHSPLRALVRSSPEAVRSQVFACLRVLTERSTVQIVDDKVKAINKAC